MVNNMDLVGYKYHYLIYCNGLFFGKSILQQESILRKLILCYLFTVPETPLFRRFLKKNGGSKNYPTRTSGCRTLRAHLEQKLGKFAMT